MYFHANLWISLVTLYSSGSSRFSQCSQQRRSHRRFGSYRPPLIYFVAWAGAPASVSLCLHLNRSLVRGFDFGFFSLINALVLSSLIDLFCSQSPVPPPVRFPLRGWPSLLPQDNRSGTKTKHWRMRPRDNWKSVREIQIQICAAIRP